MEYSMTFLARGVCGSLPMVTMSGPLWTIFSTSRRILRRSMSRFLRTLAATPEPSLTRPRRMCSVPMYSWLERCASWLASCITLRARSVKRSYMAAPTPILLSVPAALYSAIGFDVPRPASIPGQVAVFEEAPGVLLGPHRLGPVAVDLAAPERGMAAHADQHPGLGMTGDLAIEDFALPLQLRGDAEPLAVVNPAAADERVAVLANRHFGQG